MGGVAEPLPGLNGEVKPPRRSRVPWWGKLLVVVGLLFGALMVCLVYIAAVAPETKIYAANEVPRRFLLTIRKLGLLEEGEKLRFFYSPALFDIREQFCFVSDRKVAVYDREAEPRATRVEFGSIANAELESSTTWLEDSGITLTLKDGEVVAFEVSSELKRDEKFLEAIQLGMQRSQARIPLEPADPATPSGLGAHAEARDQDK